MSASLRSPRRLPVERERYRAVARHTGVRARLARPLWIFDGALLVLACVFLLVAAPQVGGAVGTGVDDLGSRLGELLPALGTRSIDLPSGGGTVSAADPIAKGLPDFTREPALTLAGQIPSFALQPGRTVEISLNGAVAVTATPDSAGAFAASLTLREGPNAITLTLLAGKDIVSHASYTVVLDRQPPPLAVTRPKSGESLEGPTVSVEGKTEAGATITVNERTVLTAPDGSFTDTFTASPGDMTLVVVARDRAGNETTVRTPITVRPPATTAPLAVSVTLDRTRVTPGAWVIAEIRVNASGVPRAGERVTLSVGVIAIGSAITDASGVARIGFAAPPNEGDAAVVVLANGATGRATLTVAR